MDFPHAMDFRTTNPDQWQGNVDFLDLFGEFVPTIPFPWLTFFLKI